MNTNRLDTALADAEANLRIVESFLHYNLDLARPAKRYCLDCLTVTRRRRCHRCGCHVHLDDGAEWALWTLKATLTTIASVQQDLDLSSIGVRVADDRSAFRVGTDRLRDAADALDDVDAAGDAGRKVHLARWLVRAAVGQLESYSTNIAESMTELAATA